MGQIFQCCDNRQPLQQSILQEARLYRINQDYVHFFGQDWFGRDEKILFDPDKFIYLYQDYKTDQMYLEKVWLKADLANLRHGELVRTKGSILNKKWQYLIRRGVPSVHAKTIILDIFKVTYLDWDLEYLSALKVVFKNKPIPKTFKHVPVFGCQTKEDDDDEFIYMSDSQKKLQLLLQVQVLNQNGIEAVTRLLWVIKQQHYQLEYNPMLVHIIVLCLIYLTEAQTYCLIQFMIKDSQVQQNENDLRWHLIMNEQQFKDTAYTFYETVSQKSKSFAKIYDKLKEINFDYFELFQEMSISLMLTFLPFSVCLKIFVMYLNEGIKIYFRIFYASLRLLKSEIINCSSAATIKQTIRNKMLNISITDHQKLIKQAFKLRLNNAKKAENAKASIAYVKNMPCYLPIPSTESSLLSSEEVIVYKIKFEILWDWMPSYQKLQDPNMIFSTRTDGCSLKQLYLKCSSHLDSPMLLIVETVDHQVFGVFSDVMLQITNVYIGSEVFLFTFKPQQKKYFGEHNRDHLYGAADYFSFGSGRDGPAFQLDGELTKGITHESYTYQNPPLTADGKFKVSHLEVFYLN